MRGGGDVFLGARGNVEKAMIVVSTIVVIYFYSQPIDVILSPPPDLIVSSLEAEDTYTTGSTLRVVFTVRNNGAGEPFERYWNDELVSEISLVDYKADSHAHLSVSLSRLLFFSCRYFLHICSEQYTLSHIS